MGMQGNRITFASYLLKFSMIGMGYGILFKFVGLINHIYSLSYLSSGHGRESNLGNLIRRNLNVVLHLDVEIDFFQTWYDDRHHLTV